MRAVFGDSQSVVQMRQLMAACARTNASVLIQGETGSGKEVVCRELHRLSSRAHKPLVPLNCAAIPATLLESELFGYRKGAYTGAVTDRKGRLELADGGTLFLDEIGDMPMDLQAKLLRFLEDRVVEPLGGACEGTTVDVRVVAATHKDLPGLVQAKQFREDLFYRLNVVPLHVPPLRERRSELPDLCRHFARQHALEGVPISLTEQSLALLADYGWPGNVRELSNLIVRLSVLFPGQRINLLQVPPTLLPPGLQPLLTEFSSPEQCGAPLLAADGLPPAREERLLDYFRDPDLDLAPAGPTEPLTAWIAGLESVTSLPVEGIETKRLLERLETTLMRLALQQSGHNNTHAARLLGMERTTFIQKLARYSLASASDR